LSEPKLISPLLDEYIMGETISDHHGVRCCPAIHKETDKKYIVKILSLPASYVQLDALLLTGAYDSRESALAYFQELADGILNEAQLLQQLSKLEGFVSFTGWQLEPMEDGNGYDVYLLGEYRPTLERHITRNPMTHLEAVNLGLDMCAALSVARQSGHLYVDLKPENIVITGQGEYRVGDLGFIPLESLKYASLPEKYRSAYTAPEIVDAYSTLNATIDIYAAGLILYQAYNNGLLPTVAEGEPISSPEYADYEMAEIILKACAAAPEDRWQSPLELGQALIAYMQRNDVTNTPIIPLPVAEEPEDDEIAEETEDASEEPTEKISEEEPMDSEEFEQLSEEDKLDLVISEQAEPEDELSEPMEDAPVTEEVGEMLAQADDLIAHETPDPVIPPEPIDVPIPPMIQPEEEQEETAEEAADEAEQEPAAEDTADQEPAEAEEEEPAEVVPAPTEEEIPEKPKRSHKKLFIALAAILTVIALAAGGLAFFEFIYTQTVTGITLSGSEDNLTVLLDTDIDNSLLTVVCSNTYGSSLRAPVENNKAHFTGLTPDTQYKITVEISGFHRLIGTTTATYTTLPRTEITSFTAVTGAVDGSVILSFVVNGYDDTGWTVYYSAAGEEEKSVKFTSHMVTINGLTVGKEYSFRLEPSSTEYIVGTYEITHKASNVVLAENLTIFGFQGNTLSATWTTPEGAQVSGWTVRCYNDAGYDTTVTVYENAVSFPDLDPAAKYTLDICAIGMSQCAQGFVSENSITVSQIQVDDTTADQLTVTWEYTGNAPEGGWLVLYSISGSEPQVIQCAENSCIISTLIPNSVYDITIKPANGVSIFGAATSYTVPDYGTFSGYRVTAANMEFLMCNTPNKTKWNRNDLKAADYTNNFAVGKRASFLVHLRAVYSGSTDLIVTRFVIRDKVGNPVIVEDSIRTWSAMWGNTGYCSLDIPAMPQTPGNYTVEIYFNNAYVTTQSFAVQ